MVAEIHKLDIHVICLTEKDEIEDRVISIPGYTVTRNDRKEKRGGDTAFYVRNEINFTPIDAGNIPSNEMEATLVDISYLNLFFVSQYIPSRSSADTHKKIQVIEEGIIEVVNKR